jgi:hypothetical protein
MRSFCDLAQKNISRALIELKWMRDKAALPLSSEHKQIYKLIHILCERELGSSPCLVNCRDFNDRIQWLKLFDQDREIVRCSDKLGVRERVRERLGDEYLTKVYQVASQFGEIKLRDLPEQFVIKANHNSGTVQVVHDRSCLDLEAARSRFDQALRRAYGWSNGEWAYAYVKPMLFVEEFLGNPSTMAPPPDYKFHCCNGKVKWLQYIYDRGNKTKECIVDSDGVATGIHFDQNMIHSEEFQRPTNWIELCNTAETLAKGFKYARVDLFNLASRRIICGEITFYPLMGCYTTKGQRILGQLLDFDRTTFKPFLIPTLEAEQSRFSLYSEGL